MKMKPRVKKVLFSLATTTSIIVIGVVPAEAQKARGLGSHVKVGTWNNSNTSGYVHGKGSAYSRQQGGIYIEGGGNSNSRPCHNCGDSGGQGGYGFRGGYNFERGAGIRGTGSFGLNETTHFGAEGSSWTQFQW
jgi:hypothetical protein